MIKLTEFKSDNYPQMLLKTSFYKIIDFNLFKKIKHFQTPLPFTLSATPTPKRNGFWLESNAYHRKDLF